MSARQVNLFQISYVYFLVGNPFTPFIGEIKTATKRFLKFHFEFAYYTFFLFIWNWYIVHIDTQRHQSSFVNYTQSHTKMGKIYTRFQTKTVQKPYPLGRPIPTYIWLI